MAEAKDALACPITYVELRDLEKDFEDVETEISKCKCAHTKFDSCTAIPILILILTHTSLSP